MLFSVRQIEERQEEILVRISKFLEEIERTRKNIMEGPLRVLCHAMREREQKLGARVLKLLFLRDSTEDLQESIYITEGVLKLFSQWHDACCQVHEMIVNGIEQKASYVSFTLQEVQIFLDKEGIDNILQQLKSVEQDYLRTLSRRHGFMNKAN